MTHAVWVRAPGDCTRQELQVFEHLVRQAFAGSDDGLPERIATARWLAFDRSTDGEVTAIAGLKKPARGYREDVFAQADARHDAAGYPLELGWVYVVAARRQRGIAARLCALLLQHAAGDGIFATTRPDNTPMIRILRNLHFVQDGRPYPHVRRAEELLLFVRPGGAEASVIRRSGAPRAPAPGGRA